MQVSNTLPIQGARVQPSQGGGEQLSSLQAAIKDLASKLMTTTGELDESSPLGKLVATKMPRDGLEKALLGGGQAQVEKALQSLLEGKLDGNIGSGQTQSRTPGVGGPSSAGSAAPSTGVGGANGGEEDLMTQLLKLLVQSMLGGMLKGDGKGNSHFSDKDQAMLSKVGEFMDQNPSKFPPPDSGSWKTELSKGGGEQDNLLNADETSQVKSALNMLSGQLEAGSVGNGQGSLGSGGGSGGFGGGGSTPVGGGVQGGISAEELGAALLKLLEQGAKGQTSGPQQLTPREQQTLNTTSAQTAQDLLQVAMPSGGSQISAISAIR